MIQWAFTDDGHGDGRLDVGKYNQVATETGVPSLALSLGALRSIFLAGRAETTGLVNEFYDGLVAESKLSALGRAQSPFDADVFAAKLTRRHALVEALMVN